MIHLEHSIQVRVWEEVVWAFLTSADKSMIVNRFHTDLELTEDYNLKKGVKLFIKHNFGIGSHQLTAIVRECTPPSLLSIEEFSEENPKRGFHHKITFNLTRENDFTNIHYTVEGTFGHQIQDIPFKPILSGVMIEELLKFKQILESSNPTAFPLESPEATFI